MSKTGRWMVVGGGALLVGQILLAWSAEGLWAQTKGERPPSYQYVGVDQTMARVETATGRIEVLAKRGEPRASLLTRDTKPWEWVEVPIRTGRHTDEGKTDAGTEPPQPPRATQDAPPEGEDPSKER